MSGPYQTEQEATAASLYAQQGRPWGERIGTLNLADLAAACSGLGLGAYDRRIIEWLAGWEPSTVAVVCGLITRARLAGLAPGDLRTVLDALDAAAEYKRDWAATCPDCEASPAELCGTCEHRLARAEEYDALAEVLRRQP